MFAALFQIDPWGEQRADLRAGIVASVVANANRDSKRKPDPFKPADFMFYRPREERPAARKLESQLLAAFGLTLDPKKRRKPH